MAQVRQADRRKIEAAIAKFSAEKVAERKRSTPKYSIRHLWATIAAGLAIFSVAAPMANAQTVPGAGGTTIGSTLTGVAPPITTTIPGPVIITGGGPGGAVTGLPINLPGTDVTNGMGGATQDYCTGACPTPGEEEINPLQFIPVATALIAALDPEANPTNEERFGTTTNTLMGINTGNAPLVRMGRDGALNVLDASGDLTTEGRGITASMRYATPVRNATDRPISFYGKAALGATLLGPGGLFMANFDSDVSHIWGAITPNEWDARARALPTMDGTVNAGEYTARMSLEDNQVQAINTPYGRMVFGIQTDNNNLESYVLFDAPSDSFGDMDLDGRFADAGLWRGRDGLAERILNNLTSLLLINQETHDSEPLADTERLYVQAATYTSSTGEERTVLIVGARQTEANITDLNLSFRLPTLDAVCSGRCSPTAYDMTLTSGGNQTPIRLGITRRFEDHGDTDATNDTTLSIPHSIQLLGDNDQPTGLVYEFSTDATNYDAWRNSIRGPGGEHIQLSPLQLREIYRQLPFVSAYHSSLHNELETIMPGNVSMTGQVLPADAAAIAAYVADDFTTAQIRFVQTNDGDARDSIATLTYGAGPHAGEPMPIMIDGHAYFIQAELGAQGENPTKITLSPAGDQRLLNGSEGAQQTVYTVTNGDFVLETGPDVMARTDADDCLEDAILNAFKNAERAPVIAAAYSAPAPNLALTPATPEETVPLNIVHIDVDGAAPNCFTFKFTRADGTTMFIRTNLQDDGTYSISTSTTVDGEYTEISKDVDASVDTTRDASLDEKAQLRTLGRAALAGIEGVTSQQALDAGRLIMGGGIGDADEANTGVQEYYAGIDDACPDGGCGPDGVTPLAAGAAADPLVTTTAAPGGEGEVAGTPSDFERNVAGLGTITPDEGKGAPWAIGGLLLAGLAGLLRRKNAKKLAGLAIAGEKNEKPVLTTVGRVAGIGAASIGGGLAGYGLMTLAGISGPIGWAAAGGALLIGGIVTLNSNVNSVLPKGHKLSGLPAGNSVNYQEELNKLRLELLARGVEKGEGDKLNRLEEAALRWKAANPDAYSALSEGKPVPAEAGADAPAANEPLDLAVVIAEAPEAELSDDAKRVTLAYLAGDLDNAAETLEGAAEGTRAKVEADAYRALGQVTWAYGRKGKTMRFKQAALRDLINNVNDADVIAKVSKPAVAKELHDALARVRSNPKVKVPEATPVVA